MDEILRKNPKGGHAGSFQVGEHVEVWGRVMLKEGIEAPYPFPIPRPLYVFHPVVLHYILYNKLFI